MTSSKATSQALTLQDQEAFQGEEALKNNNHAVIVLASGLSQRLGQAKQLLFKNGEPLICSMIKLALSTKPQTIIVIIPDNKPAIKRVITELALQYSIIQTVINPTPETGMANSLSLGIKALANLDNSLIDRVLIMGIDQVLLDKQHLLALLGDIQTVTASAYKNLSNWSNWQDLDQTTTTETFKKDIIGLPLAINYKLLKQWQTLLSGDKGLRHLIRGLPPSQIHAVSNKQLSYDIDTPEQLTYAKQQGWIGE